MELVIPGFSSYDKQFKFRLAIVSNSSVGLLWDFYLFFESRQFSVSNFKIQRNVENMHIECVKGHNGVILGE